MHTVVVGGGILGLASAYYLRQRGVDVNLLEKSSLGAGSTDRANGGIRAQFSSPVSAKLSLESMAVWERFEETFGVDIGYRRPGYLFLAREDATAEQFKQNVARQRRVGVDARFLGPSKAEERCPELCADEFVGAAYSPDDGIADPHLALQGFAQAAMEAGVDVQTRTEVVDVLQDADGTVTGVRTKSEHIDADFVVNAAGPWASRIGRMAGLDLPVSPKRRKLAVVDPETPVPEVIPLTIDADRGVHFRPERDGRAVCGGHFDDEDPDHDPDGFREKASLEWAATVVDELSNCAEYFGPETRIRRSWAGLYAVTPDHHPIIEETLPGFVNVVGFSGHGFMQSPAAGRLVAEIIADGEPSLVDVSALTADRFETGTHLEEGTVID